MNCHICEPIHIHKLRIADIHASAVKQGSGGTAPNQEVGENHALSAPTLAPVDRNKA